MISNKAMPNVMDQSVASDRIALLLAGGNGIRLQDLTQEISGSPIPKQYCRLFDDTSPLETTLARTRLYTRDNNINVIVNLDHIDLAMDQLNTLPESNIIIQPENRDTGPGMVFSLLRLKQRYGDTVVAVFPTDHYIENDRTFVRHVARATRLIESMPDKIAILGVTPDRIETGYGYLLPDSPVKRCEKTYHVKEFREKPVMSEAHRIISLGGIWNTFVMVFKLSRMLEILKEFVPCEYRVLAELHTSPWKAESVYQAIDSWNFSTRVLTRIPKHIIMLEIDDVRWSDWGTRESIERTYRRLNRIPSWQAPLHRSIQSRGDKPDQTAISQSVA